MCVGSPFRINERILLHQTCGEACAACYSALSEKDTLDGEGKLLKACNILKDGSFEEKKKLYIVGAGNSTSVQTAFLSDDFFTGSPDETNERRAGES